jgi:hypothetical protein
MRLNFVVCCHVSDKLWFAVGEKSCGTVLYLKGSLLAGTPQDIKFEILIVFMIIISLPQRPVGDVMVSGKGTVLPCGSGFETRHCKFF